MNTLAFVLSILGLISVTTASLVKGKRMGLILLLVFGGNILYATSYMVDGTGINGAASCFLGGALAIVGFLFEVKGKKLPKWMPILYAALFIAVNVIFGRDVVLTILAILATMCFVMSIGQPNGAKYRFWTTANLVLWITFDVVAGAETLVAHAIQLTCTILGMFIYDRKNKAVGETA